MTRKGVEKFVDGIIAEICAAKGYDPRPAAKGGQAERANAKLMDVLEDMRPEILAAIIGGGKAAGIATPETTA